MKQLELAENLLMQIVEEKKQFLDVLKNTFQTQVELRSMRGEVAGLLGCELRHHLLLQYLTKPFENADASARRYLCLGLANSYYYKHFDVEEVKTDVLSRFPVESKDALIELFARGDDPEKDIIPEDIDRESRLYLSLRYNAPEWVVKILLHYGNPLTFRCLRKFSRPLVTTLRLRTSIASANALDDNPDFQPSAVEGIYCYKGNQSLKKNELFRQGKIFQEKMLIKSIVDEYRVEEPSEILLYNGNADHAFEMELIESYGKHIGMNLACPDTDAKVAVKKVIKGEGLSNVNFFSASDPTFMDASVSRPQDLVFAVPDSTNFDLIPETPDYLLHFDTDRMDDIIAQERNVLEGCAKHVDINGKLIYIVFTLSKKEGKGTVSNFLKNHPEFRLLKQNDYFPFAKFETAAYVAVLQKVEEPEVAPSPLVDLAPIQKKEAYVASASSK